MSELIPKSLFDGLFEDGIFKELLPIPSFHTFRTDIRETEGEYIIEAELPGFKKEQIEIEVTDNCFTIRAIRKDEKNEEGKGYIMKERMSGKFERRFLIENIDPEKATARYEDGVLKIIIPKQVPSQSKKVAIE